MTTECVVRAIHAAYEPRARQRSKMASTATRIGTCNINAVAALITSHGKKPLRLSVSCRLQLRYGKSSQEFRVPSRKKPRPRHSLLHDTLIIDPLEFRGS